MFRIFLLTVISLLFLSAHPLAASISEPQVFEWWDSGIISGEEAEEMLILLDEGNTQEACLLAEVYAQESCVEESGEKSVGGDNPPRNLKKDRTLKSVSGYVLWKGRTDSAGHLEKWHTELRVDFYRFSLRLGSQEILTYKNQAAEAHFGQVSTRELHSQIPLDTLWGTALQYPLGNFKIGALLDTALNTQGRVSYAGKGRPGFTLDAIYWHRFSGNNSASPRHSGLNSGAFQIKTQPLSAAIWYQQHQDFPLVRLQLQNVEKMSFAQLNYRASAYIHGDSLPEQSHLSASLAKNRFWGTQTIGFTFPQALNSKLSLSTRMLVPLDADTASGRLKLSAESGPRAFRGAVSATCLEASDGCPTNDIKLQGTAQLQEELKFFASARSRHHRGEGFARPHLEAGPLYQIEDNKAKFTLILPNANPSEKIMFRSEAQVKISPLEWSLAVTFRQEKDEKIHPIHGAFQTKCFF